MAPLTSQSPFLGCESNTRMLNGNLLSSTCHVLMRTNRPRATRSLLHTRGGRCGAAEWTLMAPVTHSDCTRADHFEKPTPEVPLQRYCSSQPELAMTCSLLTLMWLERCVHSCVPAIGKGAMCSPQVTAPVCSHFHDLKYVDHCQCLASPVRQ
jgi:hypothetical protein